MLAILKPKWLRQGKQQTDDISNLVSTLHHHCAESSKKFEAVDTKLWELAESLRTLRDSVVKDVFDQATKNADASALCLKATIEQVARELETVKEKMHYTLVKQEEDKDDDAAEQMALLKGTLGTCLLQHNELQQSIVGLTKSVASLQQGLRKLAPQEVVDLSPEITKAHLEPGEAPQCRCKRLRR